MFRQGTYIALTSPPCDFLCVRLWSGGEASDHSEGTERGRRGLPSHGTADGASEACAGTPRIKSSKSFELSETGSVNITGSANYVGGIAGEMEGTAPTIRNCVNEGYIKSSGYQVGGIAGKQQIGSSIVDSCVNKGTIEATASNYGIGGICGLTYGTVRNCINIGEVKGSSASKVGGITGDIHFLSGKPYGVFNCANLASVSANSYAGGISGVLDVSSSLNYDATLKNCFNAGSVTIRGTESAGGIVGAILTGGSGTCTLDSNYYMEGTATSSIGKTNGVTVTDPSKSTPSVSDMNTWVNNNNSGTIYKTWTTKTMDNGTDLPVPNVGYNW